MHFAHIPAFLEQWVNFLRTTKQREAILAVFNSVKDPLSPEEVLRRATKEVPGLGLATVYRNIKKLVEEGFLVVVDIPGKAPRYELSGKHHHHHFLCRKCDHLYEVDGCSTNIKTLAPRGFQMEDHFITLFGICRICK